MARNINWKGNIFHVCLLWLASPALIMEVVVLDQPLPKPVLVVLYTIIIIIIICQHS